MAASDTHYNSTSNLLNFAEITTMSNQEEGGMMPPPDSEQIVSTGPAGQSAPEQQNMPERRPRQAQPEQSEPQPEQQEQPERRPQPEQQEQPERQPQPERREQPEQRPQPERQEQPERRPQPERQEQPERRPQPERQEQPERRPQPVRPQQPERRPQPPIQPAPPAPGITVIPFPVLPSGTAGATESGFTVSPVLSPQYYGQVRFLNASANTFPVNISIDNYTYAVDSRFAAITNYDWVSDGFHTVTVRRATGMRSVLLQQTFPFVAGEKVTMVLTDGTAGNLEMIRVVDTGCSNLPADTCCYRFANMAYSDSSFDLLLFGGETVFRNVGFQSVSPYKQAVAGTYQFYVVNANTAAFIRELPLIVSGSGSIQSGVRSPLVSFQAILTAGQNFTSYVIGTTWSDNYLQVMTVQD